MTRTRIKICGLTRECDVVAAVEAGADAIGLVFYPPSPRYVSPVRAAELARLIPPFVTAVGLFVEPEAAYVRDVLARVPLQMLQFHGNECAARMRPGVDLVKFAASYPGAAGILLDAFVDGFGGGGQTFDWSLIPGDLGRPLVLAGGLSPGNVREAVRCTRPWAVDVSSGVESGKGIKDAALIAAFVKGVRDADG